MMKFVIGLIAAVIVAAGGYFGFTFYAQHRVAAEVEAAFLRMRSTGAQASHGDVTYDVWKRILTIKDIAGETATQPPTTIKIANVTAFGVTEAGPGRVSVDRIEGTDIEAVFALASGSTQLQYAYKLPKLTVTDYVGPTQTDAPPSNASTLDLYRFAFARFTQLAASSVTIPQLSAAVKLASSVQSTGDITYSGISIDGVKDGKIATVKVEKGDTAYTNQIAGKPQSFNGTFGNLMLEGFDVAAMATILDPQKSGDDTFHQVHRRISLDNYDIKSPPALHLSLGHVVADDFAIQPSRLQLPALIAMLPQAGTTPPPAQAREILEKVAALYEGFRLGNFEISDISIDTPQGPAKLATFRFNLDRGKGDLAVEGLDARTPQGPFKAGHFALKGIDLVKLIGLSATMAPGQKPPAEQALALFQLVQGAEVKDLVAPSKEANKPVSIETLNINWGQFVGPAPTQAHLSAKADVPIAASDKNMRPLLAAGIQSTRIDADFGANWTETSGAIALEPATLEIAGLAKAQARLSLTNVPRTLFSEPQQAATTAAQIDTGAIEFTLHDLGGVDVLVNQYARSQNLGHDAARSTLLDAIKTHGTQAEGANPDAVAAVEAIGRFVETSQQTLVIKLTPIGKLPALQLLQLLKTDPMAALAQFKIEASTGL
ncbi:hypothetical protein [Bradyrhizobium sp. Tv2a-2]|uniref:hypothetical protein n=1 Tax=Bradyrhizobium sp. Tv2a-2 TaxID=113395 RepID=UPI000422CD26|nr:hypothetical protein [Bradyrhizobium sp. Tv2a-2]